MSCLNNLAVIPARSGSKGLIDKNIKPLNGAPLLAYTVKAALDSGMFSRVMVSTDSEEYARIALQYGAEVPFMRSSATATDTSSSWSVVREVIDQYADMGIHFDSVALLQATSPLRTGKHIVEAYDLMAAKDANAVIAVCETEVPIEHCNTLPEDRSLVGFYDDRKYRPRQSRQTTYHVNGAIYLYKVDAFNRQQTIYDEACYAYLMDKVHSTDVDDLDDFTIAEALVRHLPEFKDYFI